MVNRMNKRFIVRLILGSVFFGLVVFGRELYNNGQWNWKGLLWVAYGAISFGVLFFVLFVVINKIKNNSKTTNVNK